MKRVQQLGLLDFDQLKGLVNEDDLQASIAEHARLKTKKWYHLTVPAFINFLYEVRLLTSLAPYQSHQTSFHETKSVLSVFEA